MSYAVIQIVGKQFKVSEGDTITTDRITDKEVGDTIKISDVLLIADEKYKDKILKILENMDYKAKVAGKVTGGSEISMEFPTFKLKKTY